MKGVDWPLTMEKLEKYKKYFSKSEISKIIERLLIL